ncbi:hypothetical protein MD484_g4252, partial [Candolleomyces efflorescens]
MAPKGVSKSGLSSSEPKPKAAVRSSKPLANPPDLGVGGPARGDTLPKTPGRAKRGRLSDSDRPGSQPSPDTSPYVSKKMKRLSIGGSESDLTVDEEEGTLSGSESNQPGPDDGAVLPPPDVVKPPKVYGVVEPIIDDDDEELEVGPPPQAKEVYLEDLQNVSLPSVCGVPVHVRDEGLYKHCPSMPQPNLVFGSIVTWKRQEHGGNVDSEEISLVTVSWYKTHFRGNKTLLKNVLTGLGSPLSGRFFNAACSDPTQFMAKRANARGSGTDPRYDICSTGGAVLVGVTVGVCTRCDLRSEPPSGSLYHSITVLPHRGVWERIGSFHCMHVNVEYMTGQVVDGMVSFQTHPKAGSFESSSSGGRQAGSSSSPVKGLKSYSSPVPKRVIAKPSYPRTLPTTKPYAYEEASIVPILDGSKTVIDYSSQGLMDHVTKLPHWLGDVPVDSPCIVGYIPVPYCWRGEWRLKLYVSFVIVLATIVPVW